MIKAFIVDDQQVIIDGLTTILSAAPAIEIIGSALNGKLLLEQLQIQQPDIILLDISMPVMDGIKTAKSVKKLYPAIKILIFTTFMERSKIKKMTQVGVEGYMLKDSTKEQIIDAVNTIMTDSHYYDERVVTLVMNNYKSTSSVSIKTPLTKREIEVCKLIVKGKTNKEIAEELVLSVNTISSHRKHIFSKLGINKAIDLAPYAYDNNWLDA
ncbi:MAG: response regulator [Aureispira sp.]